MNAEDLMLFRGKVTVLTINGTDNVYLPWMDAPAVEQHQRLLFYKAIADIINPEYRNFEVKSYWFSSGEVQKHCVVGSLRAERPVRIFDDAEAYIKFSRDELEKFYDLEKGGGLEL